MHTFKCHAFVGCLAVLLLVTIMPTIADEAPGGLGGSSSLDIPLVTPGLSADPNTRRAPPVPMLSGIVNVPPSEIFTTMAVEGLGANRSGLWLVDTVSGEVTLIIASYAYPLPQGSVVPPQVFVYRIVNGRLADTTQAASQVITQNLMPFGHAPAGGRVEPGPAEKPKPLASDDFENLRTIVLAVEAFFEDWNIYPAAFADLSSPTPPAHVAQLAGGPGHRAWLPYVEVAVSHWATERCLELAPNGDVSVPSGFPNVISRGTTVE